MTATPPTEEQVRAELAELKVELERAEEERLARKKAEEGRTAAEREKIREREVIQSVPVRVERMFYKVWRAAWSPEQLDTDAKRLVVEVSVRNEDQEPRIILPFMLVDEQGREYESSPKAALTDNVIGVLERLNPDVTKKGSVAFDVPPNRMYKLRVPGESTSREHAYIPIQPR